MIKNEQTQEIKDKDDGVYVIQEISISEESEPEEMNEIDSFDENQTDALDIENLDRLMIATAKSNHIFYTKIYIK